jgi:hypothetical protein
MPALRNCRFQAHTVGLIFNLRSLTRGNCCVSAWLLLNRAY